MRVLKLPIVLFLLSTILLAKSWEGTYNINNLHGEEDGFSAWIEVKYKIWTLMDEPVVDAIVKYEIGDFIVLDGHSYSKDEIPDEVIDKLRIYDIELIAPLSLDYVASGLRIKLDTGVMARENKWGFNAPESPDWDMFIFESLSDEYLSEKEAKDALKNLMNLYYEGSSSMTAKDGINDNSYGQVKIKFDMTAMKEWANEYYYENDYITKKKYLQEQDKIQDEKKDIDNYIENKKYEVKNKTLPISPNISGKWYRERDDRLLIIEDDYAHYPNGSKGMWEGHNKKYKDIEYIENNTWKCKEEYYNDDNDFHWRTAYIYLTDDNTLKVEGYYDEITNWKR